LAECAILAAVAFVLSLIPGFSMLMGGTISWFSTVPILVASIRHGNAWGICTALVYSIAQLLLGLSGFSYLPPTFLAWFGCAMLDFIAAYTIVGFAGALYRSVKSQTYGIILAVVVTGLGRLLCSFLSGVLLYGQYAPEDWPVAAYSLAYNAAWCLPDVALALIAVLALSRVKALTILPANA